MSEHKNLTLIMREDGSEFELKLEQCEMTQTTDLDANTHSMRITWSFETRGSLKMVNYLKAQEEGAGEQEEGTEGK